MDDPKFREGYRAGIKAAADFAGTWDQQITGTPYKFEDIILGKFNLLDTEKMRRKECKSPST